MIDQWPKLFVSAIAAGAESLSEAVAIADLVTADAELSRHNEPIPFSLSPVAPGVDAYLAYDVRNRKAQGILNRALESLGKISTSARRDLERVLKTGDRAEMRRAISRFAERWRLLLAQTLAPTQLASLLEGMREVAAAVPAVPLYENVRLPALLEPAQAVALLDELRAAPVAEQERRIYEMPPEQQRFTRAGLAASQGSFAPPTDFIPTALGDEPDKINYPIIDEAAKLLREKNLMTRDQFDALDGASRQKALAVAGVESREVVGRIAQAMADTIDQGADLQAFRDRLLEDADLLRPAHLETVFRTCVQSALSDGQMAVLQHPFVQSGFPYARYDAIHDDRVRHNHLALETLGIGGTNIYRIDDPVFQLFRPPWDYCDRCGWTPITVRQAARAGVEEAKQWLETGIEPADRAHVPMPPFRPPPGFDRTLPAMPLSLGLSIGVSLVPVGVWDVPETVPERKTTYEEYRAALEAM